MEFFRIHRTIPFMRHALVLNVVSFITFGLAVFFLATRGLHLSIEFTGGTQYYFPYRTGQNSTYIFDWKKELGIPWKNVDWRQLPGDSVNPVL